MAERDPIEEFMRNYGRLYNRLEPRDQEFVRNNLEQEMEQLRDRPMAGGRPRPQDRSEADREAAVAQDFKTWREMSSERQGVQPTSLALDQSKESPDPARALTEQQKQQVVEKASPLVEEQALVERSWAEKVEDRVQTSLWDGPGHADEKMIRSAGQDARIAGPTR